MVLGVASGQEKCGGGNRRTIAGLQVGTDSIVVLGTSKRRCKNRAFYKEIVFFLKIYVLDADWSRGKNQLSDHAADWPASNCENREKDLGRFEIKKFLYVVFGEKEFAIVLLDQETNVKGCTVRSIVGVTIVFCHDTGIKSSQKSVKPASKGNTYKCCMNHRLIFFCCVSEFTVNMPQGSGKSDTYMKDKAKPEKGPSTTRSTSGRSATNKPATRSKEKAPLTLEQPTSDNSNPVLVESSQDSTPPVSILKKPTTVADVVKSGINHELIEDDSDGEPDGGDYFGFGENKKVLLDAFGLNLDQKGRIITLLESGVLLHNPNLEDNAKIPAEYLERIKSTNKTYTTRIKFSNAGVERGEEACKPGDDVVQEFLFLEEGLGLPYEVVAQKFGLFNMDKKSRLVQLENGAVPTLFPDGLSQFWEMKLVTWIPLNLELVVGKTTYTVGSGKDTWTVTLPGAAREIKEEVVYLHGTCEDPTIRNETIADKIIKLGINIQGGRRGVKTSGEVGTKSAGMTSARKFFFSNNKFNKNADGTYDKLSIGVYSSNLKKNISIRFSVRDEEMRTEAIKAVEEKCTACNNDVTKCRGVDGVFCTWKKISIADYKEKLKRLQKLDTLVTGATALPPAPADEGKAIENVIKYMNRIRADNDEERAWRVRNFVAYTMKVEAERIANKKDTMDVDGFTEVKSKTAKKLRFTLHQPFKVDVIKMLANYGGATDNKDRLMATIYRWPTRNYEGDRVKALVGDLNYNQLRELAVRIGALEAVKNEVVKETDALLDKAARSTIYAKWLDAFVAKNEDAICKPEEK